MRRLISVGIAVLFLAAACGLLGGGKNTPPPPGRRDYTWTVDTLANEPGGFIRAIWGASPNDVWAGAETGVHCLWHYDGTSWTPWPHARQISPGFDITCLYGFTHNNVWGASGNGEIYHFNGEKWSVAFTYAIKEMGQPIFLDMWGRSPSDIYALGTVSQNEDRGEAWRGFLLHYDGQHWKQLLLTDFGVQFSQVRMEHGEVFILGNQNGLRTYLIYSYTNGRLHQLISKTSDEVYTTWMANIDNEIYFEVGNTIDLYKRGHFFPVMVLPDSITVTAVSGRNENDLFIYTLGGVMHYNGTNTLYLLHVPEDMPRTPYRDLLFKNQVFFVVWDVTSGATNLVYHGILPDTTNTNNQ